MGSSKRLKLIAVIAQGVMLGAGSVWADDSAALRADVEVLKSKLASVESKLAASERSGGAPGSADTGGPAMLQLPSGLQGLQLSGYGDVSYILNFERADAAKGRTNRGRAFDLQSNAFTPQAFTLTLEKPVSADMPVGFRTDLMFGDDAEVIHSTGLGNATQPFDLEQAYITYHAPVGNGLDFKAGKFVTLLGSEVIRSPDDWSFSRSFLFTYAIPFTHTGVLASYSLGDYGSVTGGVVNGWDIVDENNQFKSLIGAVTLTPIKTVSLGINGITGAERPGDNRNDRSVIDLTAMWQPIEPLTLMANWDYGHESGLSHGVTGTTGFDTANWHGLALYAKYDVSKIWSLAGRWEYFNDLGNTRTGLTGPGGTTENNLHFQEFTLTSQWKLFNHLISRLEYRHDNANERVFFRGKSTFLTYQDTISTEVIYQF